MLASLALGFLHAWMGRYSMNVDGMSYLDVGYSFFRRDWANAVNAWWSPLYPWTVGLVLGLAKPSPRWEFPLVHLVDFVGFLSPRCLPFASCCMRCTSSLANELLTQSRMTVRACGGGR